MSFLIYDETKKLTPESWLGLLHTGMRYIYGAGVSPIKNYGVVGLNYLYFTSGLIDAIDPQGNYIGSFYSYDYAIGISYGKCIGRLGLGMTGKYIYSFLFPDWVDRIEGGDGYSGAIDIGAQYRFKGLNFGVSLLNLGPDIKYGERLNSRLPTRYGWGISIEPIAIIDSILFPDEVFFGNYGLNDVFSVKYNLDRFYDCKYPDLNIWHGSGWEFKFFNYFAYRCGSFEWMGRSNGFGIKLRIYPIKQEGEYGESNFNPTTVESRA